MAAVALAYAALPAALVRAVDGYGIDAFLLQVAAATTSAVTSVPLPVTKRHAPSFPHLPAIFAQAVPVLLRLSPGADGASTGAARHTPAENPARAGSLGPFHLADREVPPPRLAAMLTTLRQLRPEHSRYDGRTWTEAVTDCWRAVAIGTPATVAARWLWPAYLDHVATWLAEGTRTSLAQRCRTVHATATTLLSLLTRPNHLTDKD